MKFSSILCVTGLLSAGGLSLAYSLQQPSHTSSSAQLVAWSRPSLVVPYGLQMRYAYAPRGSQPIHAADLLVRFEPIPKSTVTALQATYANLDYSQPPLTDARVFVDRTSDSLPGQWFRATRAGDDSSALEARMPAPVGGWFHQPLQFKTEALSGVRSLFESDTVLTLAP
ncbi:MAG: hypothetical protein SGI72_07735 [Planctomycetota bacterium]|nr:hypothetical protein [Planctomycetota bacterium]